MIGSVHGCVSCPVVVKPWEPQSLSHPQHPLPSHPHPQSHPYSMPQRSSSVHPLSQSISSDDKTQSSSLSSGNFTSGQPNQKTQHHLHNVVETEIPPGKSDSKKRTESTSSSKKAGSYDGSPQKRGSVFKSDQYERLLEPKNSDAEEIYTSSQKRPTSRLASPEAQEHYGPNKGVTTVESQIRAKQSRSEKKLSSPGKSTRKGTQQQTNSGQRRHSLNQDLHPKQDVLNLPRESTPAPVNLPDGSKLGNLPQLGRTFSPTPLPPTPLPSIQDKRKSTTQKWSSRELPVTIPLLSSLRLGMGLPSMLNPRLPAVKNQMIPPPPSLFLTGGRKHQSMESETKDADFPIFGDPFQHINPSDRKEPDFQSQSQKSKTALDTNPDLPSKTTTSRTVDPEVPLSRQMSKSKYQTEKITSLCQPPSQTTQAGEGSPDQPFRDVPTPQSLESSIWSLGQTTVAPEVDAFTTAAAAGDLMTVKSLLAGGLDVNAVNSFGRTALQVMTLDNTDLAEVLLKAGANPNIQDESRRAASSTFRTIAHDVAASASNGSDMLCCLLRHGADVNLQDRWGNTPLHIAAKEGHLDAVRLLRHGTSLTQPNLQGKTPIMLLEQSGNSAAKQWVGMKKATVSRLRTLCVLTIRRKLGPHGLRCWRKHAPNEDLQRQVLLQSLGGPVPPPASYSTLLSSRHSVGTRSVTTKGRGNGNGHPLVPGMSAGKQMTDFLSLRDLVPRRLSTGENTSLEVQNTSSGQSNDDVSWGAQATSSLASETGSLFETNLSSIDASQSADDVSLPSLDQSL